MKESFSYKTITLLNSTDLSFLKETSQQIKETQFTLLTKHFKKNIFFLFVKSANHIPYSDFTVLFFENLENLKKNLKNNLILVLEKRSELKEIRKIIKDFKIKVLYKETFINEIINIKENKFNANLRPHFFAESFFINEGVLSVECFLKEGLVGSRVVLNCGLVLEIDEIVTDKVYKAEDLFKENKEIDYDFRKESLEIVSEGSKNLDHIFEDENFDKEEEIFDKEEQNFVNKQSDEENFNNQQILEEYSVENIINNIDDFLNIPDLSRPSLEKYSLEDIFLPKNTNNFTGRVLKRNKVYFKGENVILKFKKEKEIKEEIPLFVNLYEVEGKKTIYNINFSSKKEIKKKEIKKGSLILENDIFNFPINPILTKDKGYKVNTEEESLSNGIMTFVGPLFICDKMRIKWEETIQGTLVDYSDKLIVKEIILKGVPFKIYKRTIVIRGMFQSPEEVEAFKEFKLKTSSGIEGFIKESLGTRGAFKAYFSKPVKHGETVKLCLYKKVELERE